MALSLALSGNDLDKVFAAVESFADRRSHLLPKR
jgi:hypothetical protein